MHGCQIANVYFDVSVFASAIMAFTPYHSPPVITSQDLKGPAKIF